MDPFALAKKFGICGMTATRVGHAALSQVYIITARDGDYILRSRAFASNNVILKEHALSNEVMKTCNLLLPRMIRAGKNYFVKVDDLYWTMYRSIPGAALGTWRQMYYLPWREKKMVMLLLRRMRAKTRRRGRIVADSIPESARMFLRNKCPPMLRNITCDCLTVVEKHQRSQRFTTYVHGDMSAGNIIIKHGKPVGLIDIDWARRGDPLSDLAHCVLTFMRNYKRKTYVHNTTLLKKLLDAYGLPQSQYSLFAAYFYLSVCYDIVYANDEFLSTRPWWMPFQQSMLVEVARRVQTHSLYK